MNQKGKNCWMRNAVQKHMRILVVATHQMHFRCLNFRSNSNCNWSNNSSQETEDAFCRDVLWEKARLIIKLELLVKAKLPHPVYAYVFRIALRFRSNNVNNGNKWAIESTWKTQCNAENACVNGMCKRTLRQTLPFVISIKFLWRLL